MIKRCVPQNGIKQYVRGGYNLIKTIKQLDSSPLSSSSGELQAHLTDIIIVPTWGNV